MWAYTPNAPKVYFWWLLQLQQFRNKLKVKRFVIIIVNNCSCLGSFWKTHLALKDDPLTVLWLVYFYSLSFFGFFSFWFVFLLSSWFTWLSPSLSDFVELVSIMANLSREPCDCNWAIRWLMYDDLHPLLGAMKSAGMILYMVTTTCCCWSYCMCATVAVDQSSNHSVVYPVFKVGFPLIPSFADKSSHLKSLQVVFLSCTPQFYWHVMCGEIPSSYKDISS